MSEETTEIVTQEAEPAAMTEPVATLEVETEAPQDEKTQAEDRKFSQAELNEIIQKEKAKAEAKAERRALKAYRETLERLVPKPQETESHDGRPSRAQYANEDDYVEAVTDWKLAQREYAEHNKKITSKTEAIYAEAKKVPEFNQDAFDEVLQDYGTPTIANAIIESEVPAKLMVHMANNPEEMQRISALSPVRQLVEIGKLEAKLAVAPVVKVSKAPEPIKPISASSGGSKDPSDMTDAEFAAWRKKQIAQRR